HSVTNERMDEAEVVVATKRPHQPGLRESDQAAVETRLLPWVRESGQTIAVETNPENGGVSEHRELSRCERVETAGKDSVQRRRQRQRAAAMLAGEGNELLDEQREAITRLDDLADNRLVNACRIRTSFDEQAGVRRGEWPELYSARCPP